jgi:hypothetical protein
MSQHAKQIYEIVTVSIESKINIFGSDSKKSKPASDPVLSQWILKNPSKSKALCYIL